MFEVMTTSRRDREDPSRHRCAVLVALGLLACLAISRPGVAQENADENKKPQGNKYILRTPDGSEIPLSDLNVSDQDIEDLIRKRQTPEPKPFVVRKLAIEGRVDGANAFLKATWTVHLNEGNQWVSVPIGLDGGKTTDVARHQHADGGKAQQDTAGSTRSGTRRWFFKGQGDHTLTLPLVVAVRELQHLRHSLRFRLPDGISATKLALQVPHRSILVEAPRGSGMNTERTQTGTTINVWGLASQFSLQWDVRPNIADARPFLRSRTTFKVDLSTAPFTIGALQTLVMQQGSEQNFYVTIPEGFTVTKRDPQQVDPTGRVSRLDFEPDERTVRVALTEPLTTELKLNWSLAATDDTLLRRWRFSGFQVKNAQEQSTELELTPREGVAVREIKSDEVQRHFGTARSRSRVTRATFATEESQLVVELAEVEPSFAVTRRIAMVLTNGQLRMEARVRVDMTGGSVQELSLVWPNLVSEGWELQRLGALGEGLIGWTAGEATSDGTVPLVLATPQSKAFEFVVIADRKVGNKAAFPVSLPAFDAPIRQLASLTIATEPTTELTLVGTDGSTPDQLSSNARREAWLDQLVGRLNVSTLAIRPEQLTFEATVATRERSVMVPGNLVTLELFNKSVSVEQTLQYRVDFGHATEIRLNVPIGTEPTVSLDNETLRELSVAEGLRVYKLPEPTAGDFEVNVAYQRPYSLRDNTIALPLVTSDDAEAAETRVGIRPDAYYRVQLTDKKWSAGFARNLDAVWTSTEPVGALALKASSPLSAMARRFTVSRALVQTRLAGDVAESRVSFVLQGRFEKQVLSVPADTTISSVSWNGESLPPDRWAFDRLIDTRVLTVDQRQVSGTGVLTVDFRSSVPALTWSRTAELQCVTLPKDVPVNEVVWQVILPTGEHLSAFDRGNTPCFRWGFGTLGWERRPIPEFADLSQWLSQLNDRPTQVVRTVSGNAYAFQQPGLAPLRFSTLDQSIVLFMGAAIAFGTAFALIRFSPRRFSIALPAVGMLLSLLSLWYAPAMQLLAQPGALGVVLSIVAQLIDRRRRRRKHNPYRVESRVRPAGLEERSVGAPAAISGSVQ